MFRCAGPVARQRTLAFLVSQHGQDGSCGLPAGEIAQAGPRAVASFAFAGERQVGQQGQGGR